MIAVVVGCGPNYKARATVKGLVTFGGKPLPAGTVIFYGSDNMTSSAVIDQNGNYVMTDAPLGEVKIAVVVPVPSGMPGGKAGMASKTVGKAEAGDSGGGTHSSIPIMSRMPSTIVRIPDKFGNPETSGLTYTVERGEQTHNISF